MDCIFTERGFLPESDPLISFAAGSEFAVLDEVGRNLPSLLHDPGFRQYARELVVPLWPAARTGAQDRPELRLYYVRLGFLASAYINRAGGDNSVAAQYRRAVVAGLPRARAPANPGLRWLRALQLEALAARATDCARKYRHDSELRPPLRRALVHPSAVEIEAIGADMLRAIEVARVALASADSAAIDHALGGIEQAMRLATKVPQRIPEHMDAGLYYKTFRPYIRFFENVVYEGVDQAPVSYRGETGAQSSLIPALVAFLKIAHRPSLLTNHLADTRNYMPPVHRALIVEIEAMPSVRDLADRDAFNGVLDAVVGFREVHYGWAQQYVNRRTDDPRGTGGTPYVQWLRQLIDETRAWQIASAGRSAASSAGL